MWRCSGRQCARKGDNVARDDYHYSDTELREWVPRTRTMALQAAMVLIVFNNHSKGQAVQNARRILLDVSAEAWRPGLLPGHDA